MVAHPGAGVADLAAGPTYVPLTALVLPLMLGSLILGPRQLPWFVVFVLLLLAVLVPQQPEINPARRRRHRAWSSSLGFIILLTSFRRTRLGVAGLRGESMLVDLRDRILSQGAHPGAARRLARGERAALRRRHAVRRRLRRPRPADGDRLDVAVVDVSGKGEGAGTRALLLSGAFGGLLGALPPEEFLAAANDFLLARTGTRGSPPRSTSRSTSSTGAYEVRIAGHPPAALRDRRARAAGRCSRPRARCSA